MYEVKEIKLQNAKHEKTRLVINFYDEEMAVIGEFIMTDVPLRQYKLIDEVKSLLTGETSLVEGSGNRTAWYITAETAVIEDLFVEMDGLVPCEINTKTLLTIMEDWRAQKMAFDDNHSS